MSRVRKTANTKSLFIFFNLTLLFELHIMDVFDFSLDFSVCSELNVFSDKHIHIMLLLIFGFLLFFASCEVHEGFYLSAKSVESTVLKWCQELQNRFPSFSVIVTGHSLGDSKLTDLFE